MNTISISDQHLKYLQKHAADREGPSTSAATVLSELLDLLMESEAK